MHNWTCNLTGKECIHNNALPDDGVYENCRLCDVYRAMAAKKRTNKNEHVVQHDTLQITVVKGEWIKKKTLYSRSRNVYCSQCGRVGQVEWKGCPYCLSVMPAGISLLQLWEDKKQ